MRTGIKPLSLVDSGVWRGLFLLGSGLGEESSWFEPSPWVLLFDIGLLLFIESFLEEISLVQGLFSALEDMMKRVLA